MSATLDHPALHRVAARVGRSLGAGHITHPEAEDRIRACARTLAPDLFVASDHAPFLALMARLGHTMSRAAAAVASPPDALHAHLCAMVRGRAPRPQLVAAAITLARGFGFGDIDPDEAERMALAAVTATLRPSAPAPRAKGHVHA